MSNGRSATRSGSRPSGRASKAVSSVPASIPCAGYCPIIISLHEHSQKMFQGARDCDEKGRETGTHYNLAVDASSAVHLGHLMLAAASAIEARMIETEGLDAKHESATRKGDAQ